MKPILFISILFSLSLSSQSYIGVTIDNAKMLNSDPGYLRPGVGCSVNYLIRNDVPIGAGCNYVTVGISAISYPHTGCNYTLCNLNNGIDDSYNYLKILIGYRISIRFADQYGNYSMYFHHSRVEGLTFEPRIGTMLFDFSNNDNHNRTVLVSPKFNYIYNNLEMSVYGDYAQSKRHTNIGYLTTFSVGFSVGYYFKIY